MSKPFVRVILFVMIVLVFSGLSGCRKLVDGVLEIYEKTSGGSIFKAVLFEDQDSYPIETEFTIMSTSGTTIKGFFWPNKSAKDLGYTELAHNKSSFISKEGENYPGKKGNWKELRPVKPPSGGGSGGGSNGNGSCSGSYNGPSGDIQLDAFCQFAYAKRCIDGKPLSDPQVQSSCQTYNSLREPGVPDCPYCK